MRTFGFGKEAHGVDGHRLYVYRGQEGKENKVWEGERTEEGIWGGAHLINRLTFHTSLPHTALVAFWVASPSTARSQPRSHWSHLEFIHSGQVELDISLLSAHLIMNVNTIQTRINSFKTMARVSLVELFLLCLVFPIHSALGTHIFLIALTIWE